MKPSKTLLPLALAAAAPSVLASSSSPRRLSGKSGKAATASGVATPADYTSWLVGSYTECLHSGVATLNGVLPSPHDHDDGRNLGVLPGPGNVSCVDGEGLEIVHLGGYSFQATFFRVTGSELKLKWLYYGTGSYNLAKAGNIVFTTDYTYIFNGTDWVDLDDPEKSDTEFMTCSQLPGDDTGTSIACDFVSDGLIPNSNVEYANTATYLFTDPSK